MQKLKLNDEVVVIAGKDKGKSGNVLRLGKDRVIVSGVNVKRKSIKPTQENPDGGFVDVETALHISNVAVKSPKDGKPTRVKVVRKDNKNVRVAVRCGTELS
ncbi:MAG: 50S ribosomal protein L24 [Bacteriovoracaceae bacterium]